MNFILEKIIYKLSLLKKKDDFFWVELVGNFAEMIEELGNPFKLGFAAQGEDTDMWKNLDGCEEAEIFESVEDAKSQMT